MLDFNNVCRSTTSSQFSLALALLLAGSFGLVTAIVIPSLKPQQSSALANSTAYERQSARKVSVAISQEIPDAESEELVRFCSKHVTELRSFVLFRSGTCVVVDEPCTDPIAEACRKLTNCAVADARFVSEFTRDGNLIVVFEEPVFHRFSNDELNQISSQFDENTPGLLNQAADLTTDEDRGSGPCMKVGLLARQRMLEDASHVVPVKIIRANSRYTAAR